MSWYVYLLYCRLGDNQVPSRHICSSVDAAVCFLHRVSNHVHHPFTTMISSDDIRRSCNNNHGCVVHVQLLSQVGIRVKFAVLSPTDIGLRDLRALQKDLLVDLALIEETLLEAVIHAYKPESTIPALCSCSASMCLECALQCLARIGSLADSHWRACGGSWNETS